MATVRHRQRIQLAEVQVLKRVDVTDDLFLMWIEKPEGFTFKAGQYCTIGTDGIERAYSISSAPYEDTIELFVELVPPPEGQLTPKLWKLVPGDRLTIRPRAKGIFTFKPAFEKQMLISTVTGVVPYVSFLREYLHNGMSSHHFYVLQGASYADEFTYKDELETLAEEHPDLITYVPTVSRPEEDRNVGWMGETDRVNSIVEGYADKWGLTPEDTLLYACGHPGMIEDVKERMTPHGFKVEEERFWKQE